jgi:BirA family transcriptional regulator, biotin operon repressor / biotin---[acetyl-CoA-carboxylase] ligase
MAFGHPHRHYCRTDSTNTRSRELAAAGAPHGTVVTASEQSEGRGRQGRSWTAPAGKALLYSAIVRPLDERHLLLPLAVPLAVCEAAEELEPGIECGVKWPNDVQIDGRKLAGILIEARPQDGWAVIGIGLNLSIATEEFPPELRDTAVSIFDSSFESRDESRPGMRVRGESRRSLPAVAPPGLPPAFPTATEALSRRLDYWINAEQTAVLTAWRDRDALRGREIAWEGGSGIADGVDDRGYLVVIAPGGDRIALGAGEVHLRRL